MTEVSQAPIASTSTASAPTGGPLTPLSELVKLSGKRTRAVFLAETGDDDFGGLERA